MLASSFAFAIAILSMEPATAGAQQATLELEGRIRENMGGALVTVDSSGLIIKCAPLERKYWNSLTPPDLCGAYPVGSRYGPPTTFKGKPMARKIEITLSTRDVNIAR